MTLDPIEAFVLHAALGEYLYSVPFGCCIRPVVTARRVLFAMQGKASIAVHFVTFDLDVNEHERKDLEIILLTWAPRPMPQLFKDELNKLVKRIAAEPEEAETR